MTNLWFYIYYPFIEVKKQFFSVKYGTIVIILFFLNTLKLGPIRKMAYAIGYSVNPWVFPFVISGCFYNLVYFALFMYFYSDAPFLKPNTMYQMIRCGRMKWGVLQIIKIIFESFIFNMAAVVISIFSLFPRISFEAGWGSIVYTLSRTNARELYKISLEFPYEIIRTYEPIMLILLMLLILWLAGCFVGLLMFSASLWFGRIWAVIVTSTFVVMPMIFDDFLGVLRPFAMHFVPILWTRVTEIGRFKFGVPKQPLLPYILTAYTILCIFLGCAAIFKIRKIDLKWGNEE